MMGWMATKTAWHDCRYGRYGRYGRYVFHGHVSTATVPNIGVFSPTVRRAPIFPLFAVRPGNLGPRAKLAWSQTRTLSSPTIPPALRQTKGKTSFLMRCTYHVIQSIDNRVVMNFECCTTWSVLLHHLAHCECKWYSSLPPPVTCNNKSKSSESDKSLSLPFPRHKSVQYTITLT